MPSETLHVYGDVFGVIALLIGVATLVMLFITDSYKMDASDEEAEASDTAA